MNTGVWLSTKSSPIAAEIRKSLELKAGPGEAQLPNKIAKRFWREEMLGILTDSQKKDIMKQKLERRSQRKNEKEDAKATEKEVVKRV